MNHCSNSDQADRSSEEKAFTVPVSEMTCGVTQGSTLTDEILERNDISEKVFWDVSTLLPPAVIADEKVTPDDLAVWKGSIKGPL